MCYSVIAPRKSVLFRVAALYEAKRCARWKFWHNRDRWALRSFDCL